MPAPSPMTNPSRPSSNGRLAFSGSSFRTERARRAVKPATPSGVTAASEPPARAASQPPRWIHLKASPMACAPEEQALVVV